MQRPLSLVSLLALVPIGAMADSPAALLDGRETDQGVASLSLPGRILFAAATSNTPILVVGSENTCAARFVRHFGIGETVPYNSAIQQGRHADTRFEDAFAGYEGTGMNAN